MSGRYHVTSVVSGALVRIGARALLVAALCGVVPATVLAGPFEELAGLSAGWITGDGVGATLTKTLFDVEVVVVPGAAGAGTEAEAGASDLRTEAWLHVGCRVAAPPQPVSFWLGIEPPPGTPEVPHWATRPFRFAHTLWRHGEFERVAVVVRIDAWTGPGSVTRPLVAAWTEPNPPPLDVEVAMPEAAGWVLLDAAARGDANTVIDIRGAGVTFELAARWNAEDRRFAEAMRRTCPPPRGARGPSRHR